MKVKIAERSGFRLWHRPRESNVYCDNFTIQRGKQEWRLGWDGCEIVKNPDDDVLQSELPMVRAWALDNIERYSLRHLKAFKK